jgi:hypothetical protein
MDKLKWSIGIVVMTIAMYLLSYFILCKVSYRGLPLVYLFSDYLVPSGGFTFIKSDQWDTFIESQQNLDVVVLGASKAERSFDVHYFQHHGICIFNWGTAAQSIVNSSILWQRLSAQICPKELWLDLTPSAFRSDALESSSDLIQNVTNNFLAFEIAHSAGDVRAINMLSKRFLCPNRCNFSKDGWIYTERGSVKGEKSVDDAIWLKFNAMKEFRRPFITPSQESINALISIIERCNQLNIKLRIVVSPIFPGFNEHDLNWMMSLLSNLKQMHHFELYDYSVSKEFQKSNLFFDEKHLNYKGALLFDSLFLSTIDFK